MKKTYRTLALATAPLILAIALTGCAMNGGGDATPGAEHGGHAGSSTPSAEVRGEFNEADSMFAMMMIPHHQQAVEMSDMVLAKSEVDQGVRELAQQIKDAQAPEIELMQSWLQGWGVDMPTDPDDMSHGDGMMSEGDMAALESAEGAEASRLFLEQMIAHHEGAIEMAVLELDDGINPDALGLAEAIVDAQTAEIATMRELLTQI